MASKQEIIVTAVKVLGYIEKVSSFASAFEPLFGIVTNVVGMFRKGLVGEEDHKLAQDFKQINEKLETISEKNKQTLRQMRIDEVNETFGKYEEIIKHQYEAFNTMVERVKLEPDNSKKHIDEFVEIYKNDRNDMSLKVYYDGVTHQESVFGRPLLEVYLEHCNRDRRVMEARCSHIVHLFYIGLITLMAYTLVTESDEEEMREKWKKRVVEIQAKMQEALDQCEQGN
ncbi:protein rapunzel-like [Misgurnus anguillicaudatus]|uniref:protein rapunzel-like n=1 Tax=Misgurnus anguillicaudatus TaxID=75329 RepID=UPI0024354E95|nr:protein rapunzel-like [Misgurnus anguillicaudatus]XP_055067232.1 protein rapunzel-like [Misgurnus anguillicaudatus]